MSLGPIFVGLKLITGVEVNFQQQSLETCLKIMKTNLKDLA